MPNTRYDIGICSWSLQPASPADLVSKLQAAGVGCCQLALDPLRLRKWNEIETFNRLLAAGISVPSGMMRFEGEDYTTLETIRATGGVRLDANWSVNLAAAHQCARLARRWGVGLVTFHAGFIPHEPCHERDLILDRLRRVIDAFDDRGVRVGFETGQESAETLLHALHDLDRPHAGVNFDPANMILYGMGDPIASLAMLAEHVVQVHIKDAKPTATPGTWGQEVATGSGAVNWSAFFAALKGAGLAVNCVIEREQGGSRLADVKGAADLVRRHTGGAGGGA